MAKYGWQYVLPSVCICGTYYLYLQITNFWTVRNVKATIPLPFFGKILEILRYGTIRTCDLIYNSFPDEKYVGVFYTTKPVVMIRDPFMVYSILKDGDHFESRGNRIDRNDFMSKSVLFVEDQRWDKLNSKLSSIFREEEIPKYFYLINRSVETFIQQLEDNKSEKAIDVHDLLSKLYQNIILILYIGDFTKILNRNVDVNKRFNCLNSSKFEKNVFLGSVYPRWFSMFRTSLLSKTGEYFRKVVRDVIEFRDSNAYAREDLLQRFLDARGGEKAHAEMDEDFGE